MFDLLAVDPAATANTTSLTRPPALEWTEYGNRMNAVSPGNTRLRTVADAITSQRVAERRIPERTHQDLLVEPGEIAESPPPLGNPGPAHATDQTLTIGGGWSINVAF
ncbi:hypothetical protein [Rhodococcus koreensis]|uniref:hypothetical protein n=1 Tax=Rhodococcus koreensis TaxID=99653 RepID=UPI00197F64BC|nr:hypothetical protein [Rhodococcus koreensis]QSE86741.1 hypothetical protein JWS14_47670 [Rhodococcus koreensis]